ncbi:hypothetical protein B0H11DRAFT_1163666 [Mycena galericulata]|nr:hypothetical protein B0H11DRAFT_1163666 [Mycena galericulata]
MADPAFSPQAKISLHEAYGDYCSVCLTRQTPTGSQCAHLYPKGPHGQDMVDEAKSLGLLDPDPEKEYKRGEFENGTIQCATCHQGYFTPGYLAFSPAIEILQWIMEQLDGPKHADAQSVWKIFHFLTTEEGPHSDRYYQLYSLIPRFDPKRLPPAGWYALLCNLPFLHIVEEGKFASVESQPIQRIPRDVPRYRIFDVQDNVRRNAEGLHDVRPGVIRLLPAGAMQKHPTNFWRIRVPCHVMLYLFIDAILKFKFDHAFPEVALAMKIYKRLKKIRSKSGWRWMGNGTQLMDPPPTGSPRHHQGCRHPKRDYSKHYCTLCWTLSPSNFPPLEPIDFADPDDTTPSRPARPRTPPRRPPFTSSSLTKAAAAYPTPSSPPSPRWESDSNFFRTASTLHGSSSVTATATTGGAVKTLTPPQHRYPTRSSQSSPLPNPPTTLTAYGSDDSSDYGPPDSESGSSECSGTDGDSHSDVSPQESSEEAEETEEE